MTKTIIVTKQILALYDKYDQDFGLLDERWAPKKDRKIITHDIARTLGEYIDLLHFLKINNLSDELRKRSIQRLTELEETIEPEVISVLKHRINPDFRVI